jgi:hypothetical protein
MAWNAARAGGGLSEASCLRQTIGCYTLAQDGILDGVPACLALPEWGKVNFYRAANRAQAKDAGPAHCEPVIGRLTHNPFGGFVSL